MLQGKTGLIWSTYLHSLSFILFRAQYCKTRDILYDVLIFLFERRFLALCTRLGCPVWDISFVFAVVIHFSAMIILSSYTYVSNV